MLNENTNTIKNSVKDKIHDALKVNSLYVNENTLEGEYLSNNIFFECTFYSIYGQTTGIFFYHKTMQCSLFV